MSEDITTTRSRKGIGGPKTAEGKRRVRLNALQAGLHARTEEAQKMVEEAIGQTLDEMHQELIDYYQPNDPIEDILVRRIARCAWKLRIYEAMEDYRLKWKVVRSSLSERLEKLSIMERRTDVQLHRAIQALAAKRKDARQEANEKWKNKLNPASPGAGEALDPPTLSSNAASARPGAAPALHEARAYRSAPGSLPGQVVSIHCVKHCDNVLGRNVGEDVVDLLEDEAAAGAQD